MSVILQCDKNNCIIHIRPEQYFLVIIIIGIINQSINQNLFSEQ